MPISSGAPSDLQLAYDLNRVVFEALGAGKQVDLVKLDGEQILLINSAPTVPGGTASGSLGVVTNANYTGVAVSVSTGNAAATGVEITGPGAGLLLGNRGSVPANNGGVVIYGNIVAGLVQLFAEISDGTVYQLTPTGGGGGGGSLQDAYNFLPSGMIALSAGGGPLNIDNPLGTAQTAVIITQGNAPSVALSVGGGASTFTNSTSTATDVLTVTRIPAGAFAGNGMTVFMGANATGVGIDVNQSSTVGGIGLAINSSAPTTGDALRVNQDGVGHGLSVGMGAATTNDAIGVGLQVGALGYAFQASGAGSGRPLVSLTNNNIAPFEVLELSGSSITADHQLLISANRTLDMTAARNMTLAAGIAGLAANLTLALVAGSGTVGNTVGGSILANAGAGTGTGVGGGFNFQVGAGSSDGRFVVTDSAGTPVLTIDPTAGKTTLTGVFDPSAVVLSGGTNLYVDSTTSTATDVSASPGHARLRAVIGTGWQVAVDGVAGGVWKTLSVAGSVTLGQAVAAGNVVNSVTPSGRIAWTTGGAYSSGAGAEIVGPSDIGMFISSGQSATVGRPLTLAAANANGGSGAAGGTFTADAGTGDGAGAGGSWFGAGGASVGGFGGPAQLAGGNSGGGATAASATLLGGSGIAGNTGGGTAIARGGDGFGIAAGGDVSLISGAKGDVSVLDGQILGSGFSTASFAQNAQTTGTPVGLSWTAGAHTGLANVEQSDWFVDLSRTITLTGGGGAIPLSRSVVVLAPAYDAAAPQTIGLAATVAINGPPTPASGNVTITRATPLWIQSGITLSGPQDDGTTIPNNVGGFQANSDGGVGGVAGFISRGATVPGVFATAYSNGTLLAPTATNPGDLMGLFACSGWDSTNVLAANQPGAAFGFFCDAAPSPGYVPTSINLGNIPTGGGFTVRQTISSAGAVTFNLGAAATFTVNDSTSTPFVVFDEATHKVTFTGVVDPTALVLSGSTNLYIDSTTGATAADVSASPGHGRLRYLQGTGWQACADGIGGGLWATISTALNGTLQGDYNNAPVPGPGNGGEINLTTGRGSFKIQNPSGILTGTVNITNGSAALVGAGTLFTQELYPGINLLFAGDPTFTTYQVLSVTDDTNATMTSTYADVSNPAATVTAMQDALHVQQNTVNQTVLSINGSHNGGPGVEMVSASVTRTGPLLANTSAIVYQAGIADFAGDGGNSATIGYLVNANRVATGNLAGFVTVGGNPAATSLSIWGLAVFDDMRLQALSVVPGIGGEIVLAASNGAGGGDPGHSVTLNAGSGGNSTDSAGSLIGVNFNGITFIAANTDTGNAAPFVYQTGANTNLANTEQQALSFAHTPFQFSGGGGPIISQRSFNFSGPTITSAAAQTIDIAATLYVGNAPSSGDVNTTITESFSIWARSGTVLTGPRDSGLAPTGFAPGFQANTEAPNSGGFYQRVAATTAVWATLSSGGTLLAPTPSASGDLMALFAAIGTDSTSAAALAFAGVGIVVDTAPTPASAPSAVYTLTAPAGGGPTPRTAVNSLGDVVLNASGTEITTASTFGWTWLPTVNGAPVSAPAPATFPTGYPDFSTCSAPIVLDRAGFNAWSYLAGAWRNLSVGGGTIYPVGPAGEMITAAVPSSFVGGQNASSFNTGDIVVGVGATSTGLSSGGGSIIIGDGAVGFSVANATGLGNGIGIRTNGTVSIGFQTGEVLTTVSPNTIIGGVVNTNAGAGGGNTVIGPPSSSTFVTGFAAASVVIGPGNQVTDGLNQVSIGAGAIVGGNIGGNIGISCNITDAQNSVGVGYASSIAAGTVGVTLLGALSAAGTGGDIVIGYFSVGTATGSGGYNKLIGSQNIWAQALGPAGQQNLIIGDFGNVQNDGSYCLLIGSTATIPFAASPVDNAIAIGRNITTTQSNTVRLAERFVSGYKRILAGSGVPVDFVTIDCFTATLTGAGGTVAYTIVLDDGGTNIESVSGQFTFSAKRDTGTGLTGTCSPSYGEIASGVAYGVISGTGTLAFSGVQVVLSMTPTWTLGAPTSVTLVWSLTLDGPNDMATTITPS